MDLYNIYIIILYIRQLGKGRCGKDISSCDNSSGHLHGSLKDPQAIACFSDLFSGRQEYPLEYTAIIFERGRFDYFKKDIAEEKIQEFSPEPPPRDDFSIGEEPYKEA